MDDQFGGGCLDRVGVLQLGVAHEFVAEVEDQVGDAFAGASAQLEAALFGHRLLAVRPGGLREQFEDGLGLFGESSEWVSMDREPGIRAMSSLVMRTRVRVGTHKVAARGEAEDCGPERQSRG